MISIINSILSLNYTILAILAAIFGAIANILARTLLKEIKSRDILGINFLIMTATLVIFSPKFYYLNLTYYSLFLLLSVAIIDLFANYFYFKSFEKSEASFITPLLSLAPAFAFIFSFIIIGELVSMHQLLLAFGIIALIIVFSYDFSKKFVINKKMLINAVIASFLFGLSAIPSKILLTSLNAINPPTLYMVRGSIIGICGLIFFSSNIKRITISQYRLIFVRGLFVIVQWLLLYFALIKGSIGVTMTLVNTTPIFVFILAIFILKEKPTLKKVISAALILLLSLLIW
ncbi:hypothetical protein COV16_00855 [Candidatus Woesearchaeota archaeon CG10_big_fil_rev_8_21_14_0_10_34_8]|nr:MAG: hypothetical protein COV16_00855 [Candidatus Woesearchaeota archaeon CG10_big_fil_rev_8_21_14_0_10_34_8]